MIYEEVGNVVSFVVVCLSIIAAIISIMVLFAIRKKREKTPIRKILITFFVIMAFGFIVWAIAEASYYFLYQEVYPSIADLFYVLGYFIDIAAFSYLIHHLFKSGKNLLRNSIVLTVVTIFLVVMQYCFITKLIFPYSEGPLVVKFLDLFYPIAASVFLLLAVTVFLYFKELKFGKPIMFIAVAACFAFAGDILYAYYTWMEIYGLPGLVSDVSYMFDYGLNAIAFFLIYKWLKGGKK